MTPRPSVSFVVINTLLVWLTTAVAATTLWPVYQHPQLVTLGIVTIALGSAIAILGAVFRWRSYVVILVTFAVFLLAGVPLAVPGRAVAGVLPSVDGIVELVSSVALGWKRLLTITLPVGDYQALLVPAFVLILATTVTALSIALRARWGELGVIAPALLFVVGIAFGPATAPWPIALSLVMLASILLWLVWRRWRRRRDAIRSLVSQASDAAGRPAETAGREGVPAWRPILIGGLILAVASVSSVAATRAFPPPGNRDVLRTAIVQPFDPRDYASPLAGFRRYLRFDRLDQEMLRVSGLPEGARIRIATLDSYDGIVFAVGSAEVDSASGTFVRIPSSVDQSSVPGEQVRIDVEITGYQGVWVPTVGQLETIKFTGPGSAALDDGFFYNDTSGTGADLRQLARDDRYRLDAVLPLARTESDLEDATPGPAVVPRSAVIPDGVASKLDEYLGDEESPGARLLAVIDGLRAEGYISHGLDPDEPISRSGHASDRITELLTAPRMIGDAEQYAVAAAIMVRQLGFPVRVVFGFAPDDADPAETLNVRGSDISAWIEVNTAQYGWVAVDPVPPVRPIPEEEPQDPAQVSRPESIVPPPPDRADPREDQATPDSSQENPDSLDPALAVLFGVLRVVGSVLLAVVIVAAPFLLVVAAKARRRRLRRNAATSIARIRGGWDEFADAVVDHGYNPPAAATRSEVAGVVGTLPARVLAAVVDRSVFAPGEPEPADADRVWSAVADLRVALDVGKTRRARFWSMVSLRSLGGDAVRRLFAR
jgi:transglutaminase-like putative cysteine protease